MEAFKEVDGRLLIMFMTLLVFWSIAAASQRMNSYAPRVRPAHWIAFLLGSRTDKVMGRTATIQIGMLVYLVSYAAILWAWGGSNLVIPFILFSVVALTLQSVKRHSDD